MLNFLRLFLVGFAVLFLAACVQEGTYPVSGDECTAEDPVKEIDAADFDCVPAG